jgi:hypothetical protein
MNLKVGYDCLCDGSVATGIARKPDMHEIHGEMSSVKSRLAAASGFCIAFCAHERGQQVGFRAVVRHCHGK